MRFVTAAVLAAGIFLAGAAGVFASQRSSVSWPVQCPKMACVNKHLNQLNERLSAIETQVAALRKRNRTLKACVTEYPVSRYTTYDNYTIPFDSNSDGNYDSYNWYSQQINYLNQTASGDSVSSWVLRDTCAAAVYGRPPSP